MQTIHTNIVLKFYFVIKGKKHWQSLPPSSPTRVMHQNQFCISRLAAKTSPAFNPSSVSPSSRDANTQMICTHRAMHHCNRMLGSERHPNDMREHSGLVGCTYYYSTPSSAEMQVLHLWNNWSTFLWLISYESLFVLAPLEPLCKHRNSFLIQIGGSLFGNGGC